MPIEREESWVFGLKRKREPVAPETSVTLRGITQHADTDDASTWRHIQVLGTDRVALSVYNGKLRGQPQLSELTHKHLFLREKDTKELEREDINSAKLVQIPDSPFQRLLNRVTGHRISYTWRSG